MSDTQDSTELLLKKARERRLRNAESTLLQREKTGSERLVSSGVPSIASGIRSPTTARKTYNSTVLSGGVSKGVAGGVRGAKFTPKREVKAVPIDEIEDDFEFLQEQMRGRFKQQNAPDFKENLLSPNSPSLTTKKTFFDSPTPNRNPLSPSRQTNVLSPTKKFFPDMKPEKLEPSPPTRTTSRAEPKAPARTTSKVGGLNTATKKEEVGSPVKESTEPEQSPIRSSPFKRGVAESNSPVKKHATVKITSSFRSRGCSPVREKSPTVVVPKGGLRTQPSIRLKPNSLVSRALAKLENKDLDDDDNDETLPEPVQQHQPTKPRTPEPTKPRTPEPTKPQTPERSNETVDASMFINNNIQQIQNDLNDMKQDIIAEENEDSVDSSMDDICDDIMPSPNTTAVPPIYSVPIRKKEDVKSLDDSLDDLMPSPSKKQDKSSDEWLDFSPDVKNTSLKRDVDCLTDSVFSSVESFVSSDVTITTKKPASSEDQGHKALSPALSKPVKKLRRSRSVSDLPAKSPARFVRLDAMRSSSTSLQTRNTVYGSISSVSSSSSSSKDEQTPVKKHKTNTYKGPLEEGTLGARPPFEQLKVLEQGIIVQHELETQAMQLLEHCQYGLEQVEAEKLHLVAGLKKNLWKYHLAELKSDSHIFSRAELPKGNLEIKNISMMLRQDYLVNQVVDRKTNQAFFVTVKVSPYRIIATNIATSECNVHNTNLNITDVIVIDNLPPDFKVTLEVYCMSYNMLNTATPAKKKKIEKSANTPKSLIRSAFKQMGQKSKSDRALTSSMEVYKRGSTTPRSSSSVSNRPSRTDENKFKLAGSLNLTIKDVKGQQYRLRRAPFHSPFEGTINLTMSAKEAVSSQPPSHKGFLTIFQEESGLGAWNRRWCSVQDNKIYYWLYPEDEVNQNKEPYGEIDLRHCKSETVTVASRLDCARPNTFVLLILKQAEPGDRTSIITESNGKTTQTKFLLSADSREERKSWMEILNKCLQSVHSWNH